MRSNAGSTEVRYHCRGGKGKKKRFTGWIFRQENGALLLEVLTVDLNDYKLRLPLLLVVGYHSGERLDVRVKETEESGDRTNLVLELVTRSRIKIMSGASW